MPVECMQGGLSNVVRLWRYITIWKYSYCCKFQAHLVRNKHKQKVKAYIETCCIGGYKYSLRWSHTCRYNTYSHTHTNTHQHEVTTLRLPTQTCQTEFPHQTKIDHAHSLQHLKITDWKSCLQSHLFFTTNPDSDLQPCPFHYLFPVSSQTSEHKHEIFACPSLAPPFSALKNRYLRFYIHVELDIDLLLL